MNGPAFQHPNSTTRQQGYVHQTQTAAQPHANGTSTGITPVTVGDGSLDTGSDNTASDTSSSNEDEELPDADTLPAYIQETMDMAREYQQQHNPSISLDDAAAQFRTDVAYMLSIDPTIFNEATSRELPGTGTGAVMNNSNQSEATQEAVGVAEQALQHRINEYAAMTPADRAILLNSNSNIIADEICMMRSAAIFADAAAHAMDATNAVLGVNSAEYSRKSAPTKQLAHAHRMMLD